ncbi:MAG: MBL fold metallo-hydrolase [Gracilibacteraceae bacterium]|nr:MBL fold metallo-hydrolase [Gracilibacteraceae bacterium]
MFFGTLASGSSGNAILVGDEGGSFLIDSGVSTTRLTENMRRVGARIEELRGIFVTHEHFDHVRGVGTAARKYGLPVYATEKIWEAMEKTVGALAAEQRVVVETDDFTLAGFDLTLIRTSHDSVESYGLLVRSGALSLGVATDTGVVTADMRAKLRGCDALIIEANHDGNMLWQGSYPYYLKKRVAGEAGHLSNRQAGEALRELIEKNTQKVVLAHLSEENNTPALALRTVVEMLRSHEARQKCGRVKIRVAPRHEPHELITLDEGKGTYGVLRGERTAGGLAVR